MIEESAGKLYRKKLVESFIEIDCPSSDEFLKIRETLTRIGVVSQEKPKTILQTCHILHKQGKYYLVHYKELFALDGKPDVIKEDDIARKHNIACLLESWGMFKIISKNVETVKVPFTIIKYADKSNWNLEPVYAMNSDKRRINHADR